MSATLSFFARIEAVINNVVVGFGNLITPMTMTVTDHFSVSASIVNTVTTDDYNVRKLWAAADQPAFADFSFLWFETDAAVLLELADTGATNYVTINIPANFKGIVPSDDLLRGTSSVADGSATVLTGLQIDEIRVKNNVSAATANVRLVLFR